MHFQTLDQLKAKGKRVLLRADLNVPLKDGQVTDPSRLERLSPTIRELVNKGARVIVAWRRSYSVRPPALDDHDERFPGRDPRYAVFSDKELPRTESLNNTVARLLPYWDRVLMPQLRAGRAVLISAHGNSLRALVKHFDRVADDAICDLEVPTGVPLVYSLDGALRPIEHHYLETT